MPQVLWANDTADTTSFVCLGQPRIRVNTVTFPKVNGEKPGPRLTAEVNTTFVPTTDRRPPYNTNTFPQELFEISHVSERKLWIMSRKIRWNRGQKWRCLCTDVLVMSHDHWLTPPPGNPSILLVTFSSYVSIELFPGTGKKESRKIEKWRGRGSSLKMVKQGLAYCS